MFVLISCSAYDTMNHEKVLHFLFLRDITSRMGKDVENYIDLLDLALCIQKLFQRCYCTPLSASFSPYPRFPHPKMR